jgi:hypothetical protein
MNKLAKLQHFGFCVKFQTCPEFEVGVVEEIFHGKIVSCISSNHFLFFKYMNFDEV